MSKKEITMFLFSATSVALLSAFTLNPMTRLSLLLAILLMSDSEIVPTPLFIILNSAPVVFILAISFYIQVFYFPILRVFFGFFFIFKRFKGSPNFWNFIKTKNAYWSRSICFVYHNSFKVFYNAGGADAVFRRHGHTFF